MSRLGQYSSSLMQRMMGQDDAFESDGAIHLTSSMLHGISAISSAAQPSNALTQVGLSVHDTLPTNHLNHAIIEAMTGNIVGNQPVTLKPSYVVPTVELPVHDIVQTNHLHDGIVTALTGLDIGVSDPNHLLTGNQAALLRADMSEAATEWLSHLTKNGNTPINILLNITDDDDKHPRFDGGPAYFVSSGSGSDATWESPVWYKLGHGGDPTPPANSPTLPDGAQADMVITINSHYLNELGWLDPTPADKSDPVPANKVDMVSELMHEFGHGLGIGSLMALNPDTGTFGAGKKTTWESLLDIEKSDTYFTGSHAKSEHGGSVIVTTHTPQENYSHLGNALGDATDPDTGGPDVMYGVSFDTGRRYEVSDLDIAILQDLGYHAKNPFDINIAETVRPSWLDMHADLSTILGDRIDLSHGILDRVAAASSVGGLLGSDTAHGIDAVFHQNSLAVTQMASQIGHLFSGAQSEISALTVAHAIVPTLYAEDHVTNLQHDLPYLSAFAHQMHV